MLSFSRDSPSRKNNWLGSSEIFSESTANFSLHSVGSCCLTDLLLVTKCRINVERGTEIILFQKEKLFTCLVFLLACCTVGLNHAAVLFRRALLLFHCNLCRQENGLTCTNNCLIKISPINHNICKGLLFQLSLLTGSFLRCSCSEPSRWWWASQASQASQQGGGLLQPFPLAFQRGAAALMADGEKVFGDGQGQAPHSHTKRAALPHPQVYSIVMCM